LALAFGCWAQPGRSVGQVTTSAVISMTFII
jgi:hypothetical protein